MKVCVKLKNKIGDYLFAIYLNLSFPLCFLLLFQDFDTLLFL